MKLKIDKSWKDILKKYFDSKEWKKLEKFILNEYKTKNIFPDKENIFKAFNLTGFKNTKVIILGQDPYYNKNQAVGLSFSVSKKCKLPPSLKNIYKEIENNLNISKDFSSGDLTAWAEQGVLLLNSVLTVEEGTPASHSKKGWETFTDFVIETISKNKENCVFVLWGNYAKKKDKIIDSKKHLILKSPHPSPFSAYTGFFGCKHFLKINKYLNKNNKKEIKW